VTAGQWAVVAVAGALAAAVLGTLLTHTAWVGRRVPRLVPALLGVHAGAVLVGGAVLIAGAVMSWADVNEQVASSPTLIDLGHGDGDGDMYALLALFIGAGTLASAALLALAARCAASTDPGSRALACVVLGLEIGLCGFALSEVVSGSRAPVYLVGVVHLPVLMAAMVATWPTPRHLEAAWEARGGPPLHARRQDRSQR
jgi:hypothetical protein